MLLIQISDHSPNRRGSFERYTHALAARVKAAGGKSVLVYFGEPTDWFRDWMAEVDAQAVGLPNEWTEPERPWTIARAIRKLAPPGPETLVHAHVPVLSGICLALRFCGFRNIVLTDQLSGRPRHLPAPLRWVKNACNRLNVAPASAILTLSTHIRERLAQVGVPRSRTRVLPIGCDTSAHAPASDGRKRQLRQESGLSDDDFVVCYTGRLIAEKGVDILLGALAEARTGIPALKAVIAGKGTDEERLRRLGAELGLGEIVKFLGHVPSTIPVLQMSDVLVCPSLWEEGFGYVNLEAMAAGLPVVASRVGGIVDIVDDGVTGLLVQSGAPAELAAALGRLAADPALRRAMGKAGRARAEEKFGLEKTVAETWKIYQSILGGVRTGAPAR